MAPLGPTGETPELATEQKPLEDSQAAPPAPAGTADQFASAGDASLEVPPGFLYKVFLLYLHGHLSFLCLNPFFNPKTLLIL